MINFPPILVNLWDALAKIVDKLTVLLTAATHFLWSILVLLFEKFVHLIQYIADKI